MNRSKLFCIFFLYFAVDVSAVQSTDIDALLLGTFEHVDVGPMSPEYRELLEAAEFSPESIKRAEATKLMRYTFTKNESNGMYQCHKIFFNCQKGDCPPPSWEKYIHFAPNQEFVGWRSDGKKYKGFMKFEENTVTKESDFGTFHCTKVMVFDKDGVTCTTKCKDKTAVVDFKRVHL